jgi:hypothetical protein
VLGGCVPRTSLWLAGGVAPEDIAVDSANVYWTDLGDGSVRKISKAGGNAVVLAQSQQGPRRIAVQGAYVYWSNNLGGAIMRAPIDGSSAPQVVSAANQPWGLVVDATYVYWVDTGTTAILKAPVSSGSASVVLKQTGPGGILGVPQWDLTTDGTYLFTLLSNLGMYMHPFVINKADGSLATPPVSLGPMNAGGSWPDAIMPFGGNVFIVSDHQTSVTPVLMSQASGGLMGAMQMQSTNSCAIFGTNATAAAFQLPPPAAYSNGVLHSAGILGFRDAIPSTTVNRVAVDDARIYWTDGAHVGSVPVP